MTHLDDGTIQAFLDDELRPQERANAAEHLLGCRQCRSVKDELARAHSVFSEAVSLLDVDAPSHAAPARSGRLRVVGGSTFVKAAGLILFLAAAASAAVPGSPVRAWIVRAVAPSPEPAPVTAPAVEEPAPPPPAPVGVSLTGESSVEIVLTGLQGTAVRLVETDGDRVSVSTLGAETDPTFQMASGRVEARGAVGGEITIELPRSVTAARLVVDGEVYAVKEAGELQLRVPAETVEGAHIWP